MIVMGKIMPKLTIIHDDGTSQTVVLDKATTSIGRDNDNDLTLLERTISRHHAQIKRIKEGYILTDLGSYNGTLVNGNPVQSVILKHNDRIKIGLKNLVFLDEKKGELSPEESLVLTTDADFEEEHKQIIESFSQSGSFDSQELLVSIEEYGSPMETEISALPEKTEDESKIKSDLSSLERSNKVLFVLYEISRHLNTLLDFRELLKKIMDLIFIVIDADYGFLILTEDENRDKLVPVVVKTKGDREIEKGKLCASRTIIEKVIRDKVAVLTSNAMADSRF
ncbi:MAG: hypothetical protein DRG87_04510, partial [Deltaproteobacteria bacterium]